MEVAQPPGGRAHDMDRSGAEGGVLGEADRRGLATLAAPDIERVRSTPQSLEGRHGDPRLDRVADRSAGRPRRADPGFDRDDQGDRCGREQEASEEISECVPTPVESRTSELELLTPAVWGLADETPATRRLTTASEAA